MSASTHYPFLTFAKHSDEAGVSTETFAVPCSTEAERYLRGLAPDVYARSRQLRMACLSDKELVLLVPADELPPQEIGDVDGGTLVGVPVQVVYGLTEPMLAFRLKRVELP